MLKRAFLSVFNQKMKTFLLIVLTSILFSSLSAVFILKSVSSEIESSLDSSINPQIITYSPLTITTEREFVEKTKEGTYEKALSYHQDLAYLYEEISHPFSYDINILTNGLVFLLPQYGDFFLLQADDNIDYPSLSYTIESFKRIVEGKTLFGGNYYRLASTLSEEEYFSSDELRGRAFSKDEIEGGASKIILSTPAYYYDGDIIKEINIGDIISYNLYVNADKGREVIKTYDFEVIGIANNNQAHRVNYIPEKSFITIIDDILFLKEQGIIEEEFLSYLPSISQYDSLDNVLSFSKTINDFNEEEKNYSYISDVDEYMSLYGEIKSIGFSFEIMLIFAFILICTILFCLLNLEINQRKNEIVTWMSMGMSKKEISFSFCLEYVFIFTVGFIISLLLSYFFLTIYLPQIIDLSYANLDYSFINYWQIADMMQLISCIILVLALTMAWLVYRMNKLSIKEILCK